MDIVQNFSDDSNYIPNLASFKTVCIYVLCVILSVKSDYFAEQHLLNLVSSEHGVRFM
jgi:hypothetical protein